MQGKRLICIQPVHAFELYHREQGQLCVKFVLSAVSSDQQVLLSLYPVRSVKIVYFVVSPIAAHVSSQRVRAQMQVDVV